MLAVSAAQEVGLGQHARQLQLTIHADRHLAMGWHTIYPRSLAKLRHVVAAPQTSGAPLMLLLVAMMNAVLHGILGCDGRKRSALCPALEEVVPCRSSPDEHCAASMQPLAVPCCLAAAHCDWTPCSSTMYLLNLATSL